MSLKRAGAGAVVLLLLALPAAATVVKQLSLEDLTRTAHVVVHGTVDAQSMAWNEDKTRIYTVTTVRVTDPIKGPVTASERIQVRQLGGTVDGLTQSIVGNARLSVGEEVVLFLDRDDEKRLHYVVGMAQGKYAVDRSTPVPRVVRNLDGIALVEVTGGKVGPLEHPAATAEHPTLDGFKARVRDLLRPAP